MIEMSIGYSARDLEIKLINLSTNTNYTSHNYGEKRKHEAGLLNSWTASVMGLYGNPKEDRYLAETSFTTRQ